MADRRGCAALGVPVEVHEPEICLSMPLSASVTAGNVTYRAKPPSSALPVPDGRTGRLVTLQANPRALRSYNRDIKTLFGGSISSVEEVKRLVGGNIVVMLGLRQSGADQPDRGVGRRRADRGQSRRRHPLGHLHHDLGQSGPDRMLCASRGSR